MPHSDKSSPSSALNSPVVPPPHDAFNSEELGIAVELVISHLRRESEYLDSVIDCSLKMKDVLRERRTIADSESANPAAANHTASAPQHEKLNELREDLTRQFVPVLEGRQQMKTVLEEFKPHLKTPTVSSLAPRLNEPARNELKQLRNDIRAKLNEVRAITMGNQAVLIYTMDFYHRLLTGLSNDVEPAKAYNKSGKLTNQIGGGMLQKEC